MFGNYSIAAMNTFTMVIARRPISGNKGPNERYTVALREAARSRQKGLLDGPLYARILWFHKDPTTQDVDNIAKRILDSLKGIVFLDDSSVSHCLTARIDATIDYELGGSLPVDSDSGSMLHMLADQSVKNVLYVEVGEKTSSIVNFGEVL